MYVELHAASAFSFLQGASLPEALVDRAAALGYPALALLDADGVYGAPRFHKAAQKAGLRAIIGAELTVGNAGFAGAGGRRPGGPGRPGGSEHTWRLPVLVASAEGYKNLCRLVTRMKMRAEKGAGALAIDEFDGFTTGLVALAGRPLLDAQHFGVGGLLDRLIGLFGRGNVCVDLQRHFLRDEESDTVALTHLAEAFRVPVVATNGVRFATPGERPLFDVLTCVHHHTTVDAAGRRLARNAERYLKPPEVMAQLFSDRPDALRGTQALAERLEYTMEDLGYRFPAYPVPGGDSEMSFLRRITEAGARDRFRPYHEKAQRQIAHELNLIERLDLAGYFLIVWDIVSYCRQHDILVQGRGSAANSAVCYSLGITAIDPIKMELLFERFLSEERGEWPDIDLDLPSGDRREQVIQHVYQKYGRLGAAMTANVITYRGKSAAREVGKALALDESHIDQLAKVMHNFEFTDPHETLARNMEAVGIAASTPRVGAFATLWRQIQDLPRHLGQHSGGMVVCQGELDSVVPLEPASMPGRVVIQWDKDDCADMGIVKVDLLGLGMMAVLQDAITLVNTTTPGFELAHIPPDDPAVYELLQKADTVGVFQVESRAQMATLPRMKPEKFYDLVVEVAIIRPGPIVGQMVHPYLNRRAGREAVVPLHPSLEPVLARTLGVPLFQEQLLRMAMVAANFTGGQAEDLRRAMGFKRSEKRMKEIEIQLRAGMAQNGIVGETAETIITSITSFALYGFPESHAASFALLAYASAYLKVHYPAAFYTSLLNNQPMGFYHPATLVKDAQRRGVRFYPIDVQQSDWLCRVEPDGAIRLGLVYVHGLRKDAGQAMAAFDRTSVRRAGSSDPALPPLCAKCGADDDKMIEVVADTAATAAAPPRRTYFCNICSHEWSVPLEPVGRFASIEQMVQRTGLRRDELTTLADIGALNAFTNERRSALWQVERAVRPAGEMFTPHEDFVEADLQVRLHSPLKLMTADDRLQADYAGMGLTIGPHPMAMRRDELALRGVLRAADLPTAKDGRRVRVAGMVITRQRPGTAKGFVFLTLEDETGISNVIIRPDLFDKQRQVVVRQPFLLVDGVLQHQDGVLSVRAERVEGFSGGAAVDAHDFY
ncbi:MAG TPA: error-prone DNA polymerase [Vicinamibacterales bacterium]|nr:error-prone DNA polymerase [Vicinamibacterales bacterium]